MWPTIIFKHFTLPNRWYFNTYHMWLSCNSASVYPLGFDHIYSSTRSCNLLVVDCDKSLKPKFCSSLETDHPDKPFVLTKAYMFYHFLSNSLNQGTAVHIGRCMYSHHLKHQFQIEPFHLNHEKHNIDFKLSILRTFSIKTIVNPCIWIW